MSLIARITALAQAVGADIKSVKAQISAAATALAANVRSTVLTGLSTATATAVLATDTVLAAIGKIQGRLNALGTAANANLTTSLQDTTVGSVLKVGDFGLGGDAVLLASAVDWNTITTPGTYYIPTISGANAPSLVALNVFVTVEKSGAILKQYAWQLGSANLLSRAYNNSVWTAWDVSYTKSSILGVVSQTAGVPTGAIIERGANANGAYEKRADGTMTVWKVISGTYSITSGYGTIFASAGIAPGAMAATFARVDGFQITIGSSDNGTWHGVGQNMTVSAFPTITLLNPTSGSKSAVFYLRADGVWFI